MTQEISIHRSVSHKHIVKFHSFFEDMDNVYILLELCRRRVSSHLAVGPVNTFTPYINDGGTEGATMTSDTVILLWQFISETVF